MTLASILAFLQELFKDIPIINQWINRIRKTDSQKEDEVAAKVDAEEKKQKETGRPTW